MNNNETDQDKRLDMSVLPDGFLIERLDTLWITRMEQDYRELDMPYRATVNIWHFNDGSMVLPDGLVVELTMLKTPQILRGSTKRSMVYCNSRVVDIFCPRINVDYPLAIKIIGVTPEYATHGKELGMEVIEL